MEFDKTRVYTALNAEELPIGSKCIFARCVFILKDHVRSDYPADVLISVGSDTTMERFESGDGEWYPLAYLIEPPGGKKYKPFSSTEKAIEAIKKHGGWVKNKLWGYLFFITGIDIGAEKGKEIQIARDWHTAPHLFDLFVFVDDGSPCGELVEE